MIAVGIADALEDLDRLALAQHDRRGHDCRSAICAPCRRAPVVLKIAWSSISSTATSAPIASAEAARDRVPVDRAVAATTQILVAPPVSPP